MVVCMFDVFVIGSIRVSSLCTMLHLEYLPISNIQLAFKMRLKRKEDMSKLNSQMVVKRHLYLNVFVYSLISNSGLFEQVEGLYNTFFSFGNL